MYSMLKFKYFHSLKKSHDHFQSIKTLKFQHRVIILEFSSVGLGPGKGSEPGINEEWQCNFANLKLGRDLIGQFSSKMSDCRPRIFNEFWSISAKIIQQKYEELMSRGYDKRKPFVWAVSNCKTQSKREDIVDEIKRHLPVDVFGSCGSLSCSKETNGECMNMFDKNYKFYIRSDLLFWLLFIGQRP